MQIKILNTSEEVRDEIIRLFSSKNTRRVAISAFVGDGADSFLRYHNDIKLYCWPLPGATNPDALESLQKIGVKIFFCNNSHIKLYWAEQKGAIITSANLSRNALGASIQKEFGIFIDDDSLIDIDKVLKYIEPYTPTKSDFDKLRREHNKITKSGLLGKEKGLQKTFGDWYAAPESRKPWKVAHFEPDNDIQFCKEANKTAKEKYSCEPNDCICCGKNDYKEGEWILCFQSKHKKQFSHFSWMYVDYVSGVAKSEKSIYRKNIAQAIQVSKRQNSYPPFKLNSNFTTAFKEMFKGKDDKFYDDTIDEKKLSQRELNSIFAIYKTLPEPK